MSMKLQEIAQIIGVDLSGSDANITSINTLLDASKDEISFVSNAKYIKDIKHSKASAIIIDEKNTHHLPEGCIGLVVDSPYWEMAKLSKYFAPPIEDNSLPKAEIGEGSVVSSKAEIANGVKIGKNCTILAGVYVGTSCEIGDDTILYPNVVIYRDCKVGSRCIIHANSTIGGDGFGFATNKLGIHKKIYQNGNVVLGDDIEVGNSTTIDRAVFGSTIIKDGVHLDNLVQVGHNCEVGEYSVMVSQAGLAGSTKLGRNVVMGGQSAASGHLEIASFTTLAARSGVTKTIKESGKTFGGYPLMEHKIWLKLQAKIARLLK